MCGHGALVLIGEWRCQRERATIGSMLIELAIMYVCCGALWRVISPRCLEIDLVYKYIYLMGTLFFWVGFQGWVIGFWPKVCTRVCNMFYYRSLYIQPRSTLAHLSLRSFLFAPFFRISFMCMSEKIWLLLKIVILELIITCLNCLSGTSHLVASTCL